jgi:hypothetical protein
MSMGGGGGQQNAGGYGLGSIGNGGFGSGGGQPYGGYGGGYGMQGPRMRFGQNPMQRPGQQFSAGGGDPYVNNKGPMPIGGINPDGSVMPTQAPQVQTGGGSPMSGGADNFGAPPQQNPMQSMLQNIGGYGMPQQPTQAPQVQTGDPYQVQNMALGASTGFTPNQGMVNMNRIPGGSAPAAYGGGGTNWQDRPIGPMRQGQGIPQGWTQDPNASGNPYWQSILNSRGPWTYNRG